jgi:hypothetical protein
MRATDLKPSRKVSNEHGSLAAPSRLRSSARSLGIHRDNGVTFEVPTYLRRYVAERDAWLAHRSHAAR